MLKTKIQTVIALLLFILFSQHAYSANKNVKDPHKDELGFFDIHYCNWPDREPFLMLIYSTHNYNDVDSIKVFTPDNTTVGMIDKKFYRYLPAKTENGKQRPDKKVFITQIPLTKDFKNGTYNAIATTISGQKHIYKDEVNFDHIIGFTKINYPTDKSTNISLTPTLKWEPMAEAKYYQVFIKDNWTGESIYSSKALDQPQLTLPKGILKADGWYAWKVHAKDMDETIEYGDFNAGSLSATLTFTTVSE